MTKKILVLLLITILYSCAQNSAQKKILFVCTHGAARSPIAAAYFNKIAAEQNLNYHAIFKATEPDSTLTKETLAGLVKDGFEILDWKPELVSKGDAFNATKIITFDCELPYLVKKELEQWNGTPSISADYDAARDIIKDKVDSLIQKLPEIIDIEEK